MTPKRIIWHHTADGNTGPQFNRINAYHAQHGFPVSSLGYHVGYHYLIEQDGTVRKAREENEIGAHDAGENFNSIGICFAGNFTNQEPNEAQKATIAPLVGGIRDRWNIPITAIEPHRLDDTTECPGRYLPDNWLIKQYLEREPRMFYKLFLWLGTKLNLI